FFINAAQQKFLGDLLRKIESDIAWVLLDYDNLVWQLLIRYPPPLSRKMRLTSERGSGALEEYSISPSKERADTVWFTNPLERKMRIVGLADSDITIMIIKIYWGKDKFTCALIMAARCILGAGYSLTLCRIAPNTHKAASRFISYLLFNSEVKATVIGETTKTLRMTAVSPSVRYITEDTVVRNKVWRKGR
ncbi:hypothetical protein CC78DRAFT_591804, partial [Lojkania enalia]